MDHLNNLPIKNIISADLQDWLKVWDLHTKNKEKSKKLNTIWKTILKTILTLENIFVSD